MASQEPAAAFRAASRTIKHGAGGCQLKNQLLAAAPNGRHGRACYDDSSEAACASEQLGQREAARWGLGPGDLDLEAARRDGHIQSRFERRLVLWQEREDLLGLVNADGVEDQVDLRRGGGHQPAAKRGLVDLAAARADDLERRGGGVKPKKVKKVRRRIEDERDEQMKATRTVAIEKSHKR